MNDSVWAGKILSAQNSDGSWGFFHSMCSISGSKRITTEQALRRLRKLGFTKEDKVISKALSYIQKCLEGSVFIPDRREKFRDWDVFFSFIFSAWLKLFDAQTPQSEEIALKLGTVVEKAFEQKVFNIGLYLSEFEKRFGVKPHNERNFDFVSFYQVVLLKDILTRQTEQLMLKYILNKDDGIYYIYNKKLSLLPAEFKSLQTVRYLDAVELIAEYRYSSSCLAFVSDWLKHNVQEDGSWDLGAKAKDNINFPISDSWRSSDSRKKDCTTRVNRLMCMIQK